MTYGILYALAAWYALLVVLAESVRARGVAMPRQLFAALTVTGGIAMVGAGVVFLFGAGLDMIASDAQIDGFAKRIMEWSACVGVACVVVARVLIVRAAAHGIED